MNADHRLLGTDLEKIGQPSSNAYRAAARRLHEREGEIEIEAFAQVEDAGGKPGAWVEGWVFVPEEEAAKEAEGGADLVCADVPGFLKHRVPLVDRRVERAVRPC